MSFGKRIESFLFPCQKKIDRMVHDYKCALETFTDQAVTAKDAIKKKREYHNQKEGRKPCDKSN